MNECLILHEQDECDQRDPEGPYNQRRDHNNDEEAEMLSFITFIVDVTPQIIDAVNGNTVKGLEHGLGYGGVNQKEEDDESTDEGVPEDREFALHCAVEEPEEEVNKSKNYRKQAIHKKFLEVSPNNLLCSRSLNIQETIY